MMQLTEAETKSVARALETLQQQDFSSKSLKHWTALFNDKFDRSFITSRVGRLALVYNSCSLSLKQRLISLDVSKHAQEDSYTFLHLLQLITTVVHSPVSRDQAMLEIYEGFKQANGETIQTFLQRTRDVGEAAWGPSSGWTMSQASLLSKKICDGFLSSELAKLTASVVISVPFQWNVLIDSILQFQQKSQNLTSRAKRECNPKRSKASVLQVWRGPRDSQLQDVGVQILQPRSSEYGLRQERSENVLRQVQEQISQCRRPFQICSGQPEAQEIRYQHD